MKNRCPFHQTDHIREFDALDPATRAEPLPYYDWLREDELRRIYKLPREQAFFLVHRYEDVKQVLTDHDRFSSHVIPTRTSPFFALMDDPDHKRIRQVMAELFTPSHLATFEPGIRRVVNAATTELLGKGRTELFETWADAIPLGTLAVLFGFDDSKRALMKWHADAIAINRALFVTGGTGPRRSNKPSAFEKASISFALIRNARRMLRLRMLLGSGGTKELFRMLRPVKPSPPGPRPEFGRIPAAIAPMLDLMLLFSRALSGKNPDTGGSLALMREHIRKGDVTLTEMVMAGAFILFAGYETTASLLSNCFVHLARNPGLFQALKRDPSAIEDFMEEALRFYTPVGRFLRRAKTDAVVGTQTIPAGAMVIVMTGAANTDPLKFPVGCAFDMERSNNRQHLSFGKGAHFCIGAPLARMQVTMALQELTGRAARLEVDESVPPSMVTDRDNGILRYEKIQVRVTG